MNKGLKKLLTVLLVIVLVAFVFLTIDILRAKKGKRPMFCIPNPAGAYKDGGTVEYLGLGYKVIDFNMLNGYDEVKVGTWFMDYNDFLSEYKKFEEEHKIEAILQAVVVKVNEKSLSVMKSDNPQELYSVSFSSEGNIGFNQGQEILIYFDGMIAETFPGQISHVSKIEILKQESEIGIPNYVMAFYYSSLDNVKVTINEFTKDALTLTVVDTNEYPYEYFTEYNINKKVKNENYTGVGEKVGEDTENSTSGFTRNRCRIYLENSRQNR